MKKSLIVLGIVVLVIGGLVFASMNLREDPKYIYATREKIRYEDGKQTFELWCYHEFEDGYIDKEFLYSMTLYGKGLDIDRTKSSLCEQTDNLK